MKSPALANVRERREAQLAKHARYQIPSPARCVISLALARARDRRGAKLKPQVRSRTSRACMRERRRERAANRDCERRNRLIRSTSK